MMRTGRSGRVAPVEEEPGNTSYLLRSMASAVLASDLNSSQRRQPSMLEAPCTPRTAGPGAARMSGRVWLQDSKRVWHNYIYGVFSIRGSLVLGNVLGFTVSSIGPNRQLASRSFGIDLTDIEVEEAFFSGIFEDLKSDEQPGFIITAGDFKHSFVVSSTSEQKRWVACLTNRSCLEEDSLECRQATPRTARSWVCDEDEISRLKEQLSKERARSDRLELKIEDLLAEKTGLQEALNAALTMMSNCQRGVATPRSLVDNQTHDHKSKDNSDDSVGLEMAQQLTNTSDAMRVTEKAVSDLVYEVSALVQQRDAALLTIATLRGNDDVYDLGSDVGSESRSSEHRSITPVQKRNSSTSLTRPLLHLPSPITVPENDEAPASEETPTPRTEEALGQLPRKLRAGSVGSRGSGGKKPLGHMSFV